MERRAGGGLFAALLLAIIVLLAVAPPVFLRLLEQKARRRPVPARVTPRSTPAPDSAPSVSAAVTAATPAAATEETVRIEIARYLAEVEDIQSQGEGWREDPGVIARVVGGQLDKGEPVDMRSLVAAHREWLEQLRGVPAPAPCAAHKEKAVQWLQHRLGLVAAAEAALARGDVSALSRLSGAAPEVARRRREMDDLAAAIEAEYGL
jgi:hypothetical protein